MSVCGKNRAKPLGWFPAAPVCDTSEVKFKPQPWQLVLLIAAVCGLSIGGMVWYHSTTLTPTALLKRIPSSDALVVWIDFAALRRAGFLQLLAGAKAAEQADYQSFVYTTRFDYMNDLNTVLASFPRGGGFYAMVEGRFDWKSLRAYVAREHGQCVNSLCRLTGSTPERRISFLPLRRDLMAMAVSTDAWAVNSLANPPRAPYPAMPQGLIWLRFPGSLPMSVQELPDGTRPFARIIENAATVTLSVVPEADHLAAKLDVLCRNEEEAADMVSQLASVTEMARSMIAREHQTPNPADFSGLVTSGVFRKQGARVLGSWPIERAFVQNLLGTQ
jgi:hypothetical protein